MSNERDNKALLGAGGMVSAFSWAAPLRPYLLVATALILGFFLPGPISLNEKKIVAARKRKVCYSRRHSFPIMQGLFNGRQ